MVTVFVFPYNRVNNCLIKLNSCPFLSILVINCTIDQPMPNCQSDNVRYIRIPLVSGWTDSDHSLLTRYKSELVKLSAKFDIVICYCKWGLKRSPLVANQLKSS